MPGGKSGKNPLRNASQVTLNKSFSIEGTSKFRAYHYTNKKVALKNLVPEYWL